MGILQGMLQLHSHKPPILHRDLKSPNLLVDKHWRVKVADFNLSRVMEAQAVVSSISANNPRYIHSLVFQFVSAVTAFASDDSCCKLLSLLTCITSKCCTHAAASTGMSDCCRHASMPWYSSATWTVYACNVCCQGCYFELCSRTLEHHANPQKQKGTCAYSLMSSTCSSLSVAVPKLSHGQLAAGLNPQQHQSQNACLTIPYLLFSWGPSCC